MQWKNLFAKQSDHQTLLLMDQMDQTETIWHPTVTRLDTSPICHIRCTFAHTNSHVFQHLLASAPAAAAVPQMTDTLSPLGPSGFNNCFSGKAF